MVNLFNRGHYLPVCTFGCFAWSAGGPALPAWLLALLCLTALLWLADEKHLLTVANWFSKNILMCLVPTYSVPVCFAASHSTTLFQNKNWTTSDSFTESAVISCCISGVEYLNFYCVFSTISSTAVSLMKVFYCFRSWKLSTWTLQCSVCWITFLRQICGLSPALTRLLLRWQMIRPPMICRVVLKTNPRSHCCKNCVWNVV